MTPLGQAKHSGSRRAVRWLGYLILCLKCGSGWPCRVFCKIVLACYPVISVIDRTNSRRNFNRIVNVSLVAVLHRCSIVGRVSYNHRSLGGLGDGFLTVAPEGCHFAVMRYLRH